CDNGFRGVATPPGDVSASDGRFPNRVEVTWTDRSSTETGYEISRDGVVLTQLAADVEAYTDMVPTYGVRHTYCVTALTAGGPSIAVCDDGIGGPRTLAPPDNVAATLDTFDDRVEITWEDTSGTQDGFKIY